MVILPASRNTVLDISFFILEAKHRDNDKDIIEVYNTTDTYITLVSPLWGSTYSFNLLCFMSGFPLSCGSLELTAITTTKSSDCKTDSTYCQVNIHS